MTIGIYSLVFAHFSLWPLPADAPWVWVLALLLYDFCYYWLHRAGHRCALFWAAHVVHHQSEDYNLSTALRQTCERLDRRLAVLPADGGARLSAAGVRGRGAGRPALPVLGPHAADRQARLVRPLVLLAEQPPRAPRRQRSLPRPQLRRHPDRLGPPVRHLPVEEDDAEPCVYGTRSPLRSWNPLWANLQVYAELLRDSWRAGRWADKLRVWFEPPGWRPADVAARWPKPAFELRARCSATTRPRAAARTAAAARVRAAARRDRRLPVEGAHAVAGAADRRRRRHRGGAVGGRRAWARGRRSRLRATPAELNGNPRSARARCRLSSPTNRDRCGRKTTRRGTHEQRVHPRDARADEGVQGLRRGQPGEPEGPARQHPRADRPQRRRQDDLLQPADQVPDADRGPDPLRRPRHHRRDAGAHRAPRRDPLVPDLGRVPAPDGARERARRAAAQARHLVPLLALRALAATRWTPGRSNCCARWTCENYAGTTGGRAEPTAASARWRSPPRWRWTRS